MLPKSAVFVRPVLLCLAVAFAPTSQQSAEAAPISYDEAIDGDLPATSPPILNLDLGLNQISGTLTWNAINPVQDDFDTFSFAVPVGMRVESVENEQTLLPSGSGNFDFVTWALEDDVMNQLQQFVVPVPFGGQVTSPLLPWPAAVFTMRATAFSGALRDIRSVGYEWSFLVTPGEGRPLPPPPVPVPEPSTFGLVGSTLLLLGFARYRRTNPSVGSRPR